MTRIRVMTWNIHGALGGNPRFDLDRVVALVKRHAPDIVALQETAVTRFALLLEARERILDSTDTH